MAARVERRSRAACRSRTMRSPSWSASSSGIYTPDVFYPTAEYQRRPAVHASAPRPLGAVGEMRDCGLLGAMFPELNEIACRDPRFLSQC
jgi:hypothetical protein